MSELSRQSTPKYQTTVRLSPAAGERLEELAAESGIGTSKLAAAMLEELLPTVASVRQRLQITRSSENGRG
jgi:hypothetical protein